MDSLFEVAASSSRNVEKSEEIVVSSSSDDKENCFLNPHHHQTQNQKTITASSRLSLQRLATLPKRTLARGLLQKRRILAVLESCRKEREVIAAIKAGEFNQLLNLADVDNKQQNLQSKTLSSSSLYDFEMNQLLYFTKHSSVASLLADPLLKPIRWPADENDPQQKMLWHIYELLGKEGDGSGDSVKIEPKEEENEVKQLQPDEDLFCTCAQTSSSSPTDLDTTSVDHHQQQLSSPPNKRGSSKKKAKLSSPEKKKKVSSPEKRTLENFEASPRARRRRRRRLVEPVLPSLTIENEQSAKAKKEKKEKKARREHRKLHRMGKKTKKMKKEGKALDLGVFTTTSSPAPSTLIAAAE